jgi:acetyltransferase-like isoleucine patch superfamily enzyme
MKHKALLLWSWLVWLITLPLPDMPLVRRLRGLLYGVFMRRCGSNFQVGFNVTLRGLENLSIGNDVYIAPGSVVLAGADVSLEDGVQLAFYSVLTDGGHSLQEGSYRFGPRVEAPLHIAAGTWIGAHVTIVAGVRIGRSVVIGANSVVTKDIPDGVLAAGVPAVVVRKNLSEGEQR